MNTHRTMYNARVRGFTLMEVLIAMAIGLVVLIGALSYFGRGVRSLQTGDAYARLHENASRASAILARDIQLAGFYGFGGSANRNNILTEEYTTGALSFQPVTAGSLSVFNSAGVADNECGTANLVNLTNPIEYYTNKSSAVGASRGYTTKCYPSATVTTPILMLRGAMNGESVLSPTGPNDPTYPDTQLLIAASPTVGSGVPSVYLFWGNSSGTGTPHTSSMASLVNVGLLKGRQNGLLMPVFPYTFRAYYIANCAVQSDGTCPTDEPNPQPTLVNRQLDAGTATRTARINSLRLIQGIQDMRIRWGMDNRGDTDKDGLVIGDGVTDYWVDSVATPSLYNQVNTVRIQILARANALDPTYDDRANQYYFDSNDTPVNCTTADQIYDANNECRYRRLLFESSASVRNCTLRRRSGLNAGDC